MRLHPMALAIARIYGYTTLRRHSSNLLLYLMARN